MSEKKLNSTDQNKLEAVNLEEILAIFLKYYWRLFATGR